jgi:hypothetical protein
VCVRVCGCVCGCVGVWVCGCVGVCVCVCGCVVIFGCTHAHMYTCTNVHMYTPSHLHMNGCMDDIWMVLVVLHLRMWELYLENAHLQSPEQFHNNAPLTKNDYKSFQTVDFNISGLYMNHYIMVSLFYESLSWTSTIKFYSCNQFLILTCYSVCH